MAVVRRHDQLVDENIGDRPPEIAAAPRAAAGPVVSLRSISKSYPGVQALSSVDIDIFASEVHAICGENGAGKSTLSKVVAGLVRPDAGEIHVDGERTTFDSPGAARRHGISAVPQEISLVPYLTVAENICLTAIPSCNGMVSKKGLRAQAQAVLDSLGLDIDPFSLLAEHGPGVQQLVMIGRGFAQSARVVILDEPTAALTHPEVDHLFEVVEVARAAGTAFIYISHRLPDLQRIADTITVLRDGAKILTEPMVALGHDKIVSAMVGRPIERLDGHRAGQRAAAEPDIGSPPRLAVEGLTRAGVFADVSFTVGAGEIVGIAGLMGAGRTEVARAIYGVDPVDAGTVAVDGVTTRIRSPRDAIRAGIAMVPEERKSQGLVLGMTVGENLTVAHLRQLSRAGWLRRRRLSESAREAVKRFAVKPQNPDVAVGTLSGGNQQKVVIGRWFFSEFGVYLFDEPTRGVDINAKSEIYRILGRLTESGAGMVVISSELPELLAICDRILVMREGRLVGDVVVEEATEESLLAAAMGQEGMVA
ncbi:sugar ABC transporter ATP-binding protein [Pseudonocardia sp. H11422]|uniref:sugar ABC transporter ATP-binding protein n=1 Tax=Pseudonocardia sp. H11422 TaxID=2835866 RepID=UPI001BDCAE03|nr:sugar ABC transporter ATP-binding protein [Pseudonocardia sp. H11422]